MDIYEINEIMRSFQNLSAENTQEIEAQKLDIIQAIYDSIIDTFNLYPQPTIDVNQHKCCSSFNYFFYNSLLITSLFKHSLSSFLFGITLLELIPGISHMQSMLISIIYTFLDSIIFYAIEISYLKKALNIQDDYDAICELMDTYILQLKLVKAINQELASGNSTLFSKEEYHAYLECVVLLNNDIIQKFSKINEHQDSTLKCIIKNLIILIGAISKIAGSYFIAKSLLLTFAASLVGTPFGILFIATIIFGGVGFFYALGEHSISKLINPEMESFNKLKRNYIGFENDRPKHENASRRIQNFFNRIADPNIQDVPLCVAV